ncbi:MAG: hypothetical protein ACC653_02050 [Gammaproteobacteria bacterium]
MHLNHQIENVLKLLGISTTPDDRNIETVMADIAEQHKECDYQQLFFLLKEQEIFIPITSALLPTGTKIGDIYEPESMDEIKIFRILGSEDEVLIPAALNITCPILKDGYMRMSWIDFLTMIFNKDDIQGATLECEVSWVKLGKNRINTILKDLTK